MAQRSKIKRFNSPQPTNVNNSGIVRNRDYNEVVLDIAELYSLTGSGSGGGSYAYVGNSSTNTNIDWSTATVQELNLDNNPTLTFSNGSEGKALTLLLKQQLTGQRNVSWPNDVIWSNQAFPSFLDISNINIDPTFNTGIPPTIGFNFPASKIVKQSDGKFIVGGSFASYAGTSASRIIRLNPDGTRDNTFVIGTGFNGGVNDIAIQSDGKIIVVGNFSNYNGNSASSIIRLNTDGSVDGTFTTTGFGGGAPSCIFIQSDDKIIAGGPFSNYDGNSVSSIVRINTNGSIDSTFNTGTGFNAPVLNILTQSDGKILVAGMFTSYDTTTVNRIVRLNANGSVDATFNIGTGFNSMTSSLTIQPDNKILVGGQFSSYNGSTANNICRLNIDGSIDNTFSSGSGLTFTFGSANLYSIVVQADGKILIGGQFVSYNGASRSGLVRVNANGSIDNTFYIGTGFGTGTVFSLIIEPGNKLIAVGQFVTYNSPVSANAAYIVKLQETLPLVYTKVTFDYNGTNYIGSF